MIVADSHEFLELYRGDKDLRMGIEMLKLRPDMEYVSFAPDRPSPNDARLFKITRTADGPLPPLPHGFRLELLSSVAIRFAHKESGGIVSYMPTYGRALRRLAPDVIFENPFSWLTPRSYQTDRAARALGAPVIFYDPGDDIPISGKQKLLIRFEAPVVNRAARIITYNQVGRRRFVEKYGYAEERIRVIPKPIDVAAMRWEGEVDSLRKELTGGHPEALVVAYLGRLAKYKGSSVLLEAARRAEKDPSLGDVRFVFLGGAMTSEETDRSYEGPNTFVTGMLMRDEVPRHVAACDVLVFPDVTRPGAFPTSVAEGMASGKPLVVGIRGHEGLMPLVDEQTALLVEPGDPEAILSAIRKLVDRRELGADLGEAVGRFASSHMDYPVVAQAYLDVAAEVCRDA